MSRLSSEWKSCEFVRPCHAVDAENWNPVSMDSKVVAVHLTLLVETVVSCFKESSLSLEWLRPDGAISTTDMMFTLSLQLFLCLVACFCVVS